MDLKERMRAVGAPFILAAIVLFYTDGFGWVFSPIGELPAFSYFLPRLIDFLFYSGLILLTLSIVLAPERTQYYEFQPRTTLQKLRQKYAIG
jgi:hypothetical protein